MSGPDRPGQAYSRFRQAPLAGLTQFSDGYEILNENIGRNLLGNHTGYEESIPIGNT